MFLQSLALAALALHAYGEEVVLTKSVFDPRAYDQQSATCPAVDRSVSPPLSKTIDLSE
jgi:soluble epoxide hydrolase/lipid-phosphate phosphatase